MFSCVPLTCLHEEEVFLELLWAQATLGEFAISLVHKIHVNQSMLKVKVEISWKSSVFTDGN